jgi:hypothetical protein
MFARREFVGRRINTSTDETNLKKLHALGAALIKNTVSGKSPRLFFVLQIILIFNAETRDQNIVEAFRSILKGINTRAFVAEREFLVQILSKEPDIDFKAFVSYLASPPTMLQDTHRILSDGGMLNLLKRKFENVENFWKYSSSWISRRSLATSTFDEQYRFFLDSSWFGNIIFGDERNSRDTPFIANLTTDFSPLLFHMHAEQMWKLAPPSIVVSILGNNIEGESQDFVKQFFRADFSGYLNSLAAFEHEKVPWIFCEGYGVVAGLIGESLGSSSRVYAGESIPVRIFILHAVF